ncbi:hypothetical protein [Streptomyces sp. cg36]|uniref:hypothetical protein n=1 Tax=Streptomyces sp. cg36 TaxID=3238798 RepID=UPI0034E27635
MTTTDEPAATEAGEVDLHVPLPPEQPMPVPVEPPEPEWWQQPGAYEPVPATPSQAVPPKPTTPPPASEDQEESRFVTPTMPTAPPTAHLLDQDDPVEGDEDVDGQEQPDTRAERRRLRRVRLPRPRRADPDPDTGDSEAPAAEDADQEQGPRGDDGYWPVVGAEIRQGFEPLRNEVAALTAHLYAVKVGEEEAASPRKLAHAVRTGRFKRYAPALALPLIPIPPFVPAVGGFSLAKVYASVPQSMAADMHTGVAIAAAVSLVPAAVLVWRVGKHLKARTKPGFTLRVATATSLIGSLLYGPIGAYALYLTNGVVA